MSAPVTLWEWVLPVAVGWVDEPAADELAATPNMSGIERVLRTSLRVGCVS
jgi:hypothetical protein